MEEMPIEGFICLLKNQGNEARKSLADGGDLLPRNLAGSRQLEQGIFKSDNYRIELAASLEVKFTLMMGGRGNGMAVKWHEQKL